MTGKHFAILNSYILIGNYTVKVNVFSGIGILHKNRVFNNCSLADLNATEKDGVFNNSLDNASVSDNGVSNLCTFRISCGCGVSNLCINGSVLNVENKLSLA